MKIFGILNVTPDSFSDGGEGDYVNRARQMLTDGAAVIDIGAESTRPGAEAISVEEELNRVLPILEKLSHTNRHPSESWDPSLGRSEDSSFRWNDKIAVSIDTRNFETASEIVKFANIKYLNDVSGFADARMLQLAAKDNLNIIAMHSLSVPADKNITLTTKPVETLANWIKNKFAEFAKHMSADKIIFDPGLGFGKTAAQSNELVIRAAELSEICHNLGAKILYGHSRKSFLGGQTITERDLKTAEISNYLQKAGVDYIRVHNVAANAASIFGEKL